MTSVKRPFLILYMLCISAIANAQTASSVDSLFTQYIVPGVGYAILSADSIIDIGYMGYRQVGRGTPIDAASRFRIGSNTKAVTAAIAASLVQRGLISWDTEFFDLLPEMKAHSLPRYRHMTLRQLLDFQVPFPSWTYTDIELTPEKLQAIGDSAERYAFVGWFLHHHYAAHRKRGRYQSNVSYAAAGLMLERAAHRSYPQLVAELNAQVGSDFAVGEPNEVDTMQTWGHDAWLRPEQPGGHYKLNWLMSAGNLNATLPGYIRFLQALLRRDTAYAIVDTPQQVNDFKMGWIKAPFGIMNIGNPGTYISQVGLLHDGRHAFIILTNSQTDDTYKFTNQLMELLLHEVEKK